MVPFDKIEAFIAHVRKKCREHGIKFTMARAQQVLVSDKEYGSGYFDSEGKELTVARKHELWLDILVHESCHLDQWIEQCSAWTRSFEGDAGNQIDEYCHGKDVPNIRAALNRIIELELDCEKRAIKKIIEFELPINQTAYIQRANAYLQFHNYMLHSRRWAPKGVSPYQPEIYTEMPKRIMSDRYYKKLPEHVRQAFFIAGL